VTYSLKLNSQAFLSEPVFFCKTKYLL